MGRNPLKTAVDRYIKANRQCLAEATVTERARKLRALERRYSEFRAENPRLKLSPHQWGEPEIMTILLDMRKRELSNTTQCRELENIQGLLRFVGNGILDKLKIRKPHMFPRRANNRGPCLSEAQVSSIIRATESIPGWNGEVARFMIATYCYTGLRPCELRRAEVEDLDTDTWQLRVRHPKGEGSYGDQRHAPIPVPLRSIALRYLKARERILADAGVLSTKPLLCRKDNPGKPYSANRLQVIKRKVEEIAGVRFELRALRRTFGQMLLNKGLSIESTSIAMGHRSTKTTETYYCRKDAGTVQAEILHVFDGSMPACSGAIKPLISERIVLTGYS